jgi:hypothetical protein
MASASDHRAHAALQPADCLILLPQRLPAAVETSIGPAHYPAECTQSDAFLQPSLRARYGRANSNSFFPVGSFSCDFGLKPLKCSSFLLPRVCPAGQFTVYKKSRPDRAIPDPAENLILFSHLETKGACSNLPR